MYNPFSLKGKTILVTGASSGIGRATAIECARLGASLILTGRNVQNLHETLQALEQKKGTPPPPEASLSSLSLCAMLQMDSFSPAEKRAAFCSAVEKVVFHKAERRISLILSAE